MLQNARHPLGTGLAPTTSSTNHLSESKRIGAISLILILARYFLVFAMVLFGCAENYFLRLLSRLFAAVVAAYSALDRDFIAASGKYLSPVTELFLPLFVRQFCLPHIFKLCCGLRISFHSLTSCLEGFCKQLRFSRRPFTRLCAMCAARHDRFKQWLARARLGVSTCSINGHYEPCLGLIKAFFIVFFCFYALSLSFFAECPGTGIPFCLITFEIVWPLRTASALLDGPHARRLRSSRVGLHLLLHSEPLTASMRCRKLAWRSCLPT